MRRLQRLFTILCVIGKYRLDLLFNHAILPWHLRLLLSIAPWRLHNCEGEGPVRLRLALEELGPIYIKFGQLLSTRRDLLSDELAEELIKLQDRVPPFCEHEARERIESSLKGSVDELFASFEVLPLASASVAQVHCATLHSGEEVVVKVVRPGIEKTIRQDIKLMYFFARLLHKMSSDGRRLRPVEIVADYELTILDELDMSREAANASQLRRNFKDSEQLYVPKVYWDYCGPNVLCLERVYGIPIGEIDKLHELGVDMKLLAEHGVEIFFTQVFRDSFFHADMHPGNIFVDARDPAKPRYIALDFGIVGSLNAGDQSYLARNLLAFFEQDYRRVAQLHIDSGWVPPHTKVNELEGAIRSVCEPIFERSLEDISFGQLLLGLFKTARRFDMQVQPQLVLLEKTLLNIEGLGRQLYPKLDLWQTAYPFLEDWMHKRMGAENVLKTLRQHGPEWLEQAPELPNLLFHLLDRQQQEKLPPVQIEPLKRNSPRTARLIGLGALAIAASMAFPQIAAQNLLHLPWQSALVAAAGFYLILIKA